MENYTLRYLPLFEQDLAAALDYIAYTLCNPAAALRLVEDTEKAIFARLSNPKGYPPYNSTKDRNHIYDHINVRNYAVFYVVIENVMEIRRFIYSKRDLAELV